MKMLALPLWGSKNGQTHGSLVLFHLYITTGCGTFVNSRELPVAFPARLEHFCTQSVRSLAGRSYLYLLPMFTATTVLSSLPLSA